MTNEIGLSAVKRVMDVSRETAERLTIYHDLLVHWQKNINLIAPSTIGEIWQRHIADSLVCCKAIGDANHIVDIGSGAGFPGLIQAVLLAETGTGAVHLVESNGKKCSFMNTVIRETGLRNAGVDVQVHNDRVEAVLPRLERPAVISARALASLDNLLGLTGVFLEQGTIGVFPKGRDYQLEMDSASQNWQFRSEVIASDIEPDSVVLKIFDVKKR